MWEEAWKFLICSGNCFGCCKDGDKVRDCTTITSRGKHTKQNTLTIPECSAPKRNHFYVLQGKVANSGDDAGMLYISLLCSDGFLISGGVG